MENEKSASVYISELDRFNLNVSCDIGGRMHASAFWKKRGLHFVNNDTPTAERHCYDKILKMFMPNHLTVVAPF